MLKGPSSKIWIGSSLNLKKFSRTSQTLKIAGTVYIFCLGEARLNRLYSMQYTVYLLKVFWLSCILLTPHWWIISWS